MTLHFHDGINFYFVVQRAVAEIKELRTQKVALTKSLAAAEEQVRILSQDLVSFLANFSYDFWSFE